MVQSLELLCEDEDLEILIPTCSLLPGTNKNTDALNSHLHASQYLNRLSLFNDKPRQKGSLYADSTSD
jgi:hypothetical protein